MFSTFFKKGPILFHFELHSEKQDLSSHVSQLCQHYVLHLQLTLTHTKISHLHSISNVNMLLLLVAQIMKLNTLC